MKKKSAPPHASSNLPVSKQTAGGISGAIVGGVIAGPVGAVAGAIVGTIMGNRAAKGKSLVSSGTVSTASKAVKAVKEKFPSSKSGKRTAKAAAPKPIPAKSSKAAKKSVVGTRKKAPAAAKRK